MLGTPPRSPPSPQTRLELANPLVFRLNDADTDADASDGRLNALIAGSTDRVRSTAIRAKAAIEKTRCVETQKTERCHFTEDGKTARYEHFAKAAGKCIEEYFKTVRERDKLRASSEREFASEWGRVQAGKEQSDLFLRLIAQLVPMGLYASKKMNAMLLCWCLCFAHLGSLRRVWSDRTKGVQDLKGMSLFVFCLMQSITRTVLKVFSAALSGRLPQTVPLATKRVAATAIMSPGDSLYLGPEIEPDRWVSKVGTDGRIQWHYSPLGPAPWTSDLQNVKSSSRCSGHLGALLSNWGLGQYAAALEKNGYDATCFKFMHDHEVQEMLRTINCQPDHVGIFHEALDSWK